MLREIMTREKGRNEKKDFPGVGWGGGGGGGYSMQKNTNVYNIGTIGFLE